MFGLGLGMGMGSILGSGLKPRLGVGLTLVAGGIGFGWDKEKVGLTPRLGLLG